MDYDKMRLLSIMRRARERRGMTQEAVGNHVGISANGYGKIENGRRELPVGLIHSLRDLFDANRWEVANAVLSMSGLSGGERTERPAPDAWARRDGETIPGHVTRPDVLLTDEEFSFGLLMADFVGLPLENPLAFDAFMAVIGARSRAMAMRHSEDPDGGDDEKG